MAALEQRRDRLADDSGHIRIRGVAGRVIGYVLTTLLAAVVTGRLSLFAVGLLVSGIAVGYAGLLLLGWILERRESPYYSADGDYRKPW